MKVTVLQENLAHGLSIVSRAVSPRSTLPVLANILIATDEGQLKLSATNLDLGITCWIGAKIHEEGSTTVPARTITDLVSTLSDSQVDIALNIRTQTLNIVSGASNTDIKCIDSQEFPPSPAVEVEDEIDLNVSDLKEMIHQVVFAASTDEARPILTGVLVTLSDEMITMAAADGFRLSVRKSILSSPTTRPFSAVIPGRSLSELARVSGDSDQVVTMSMAPGRNQVVFRLPDIELVSLLIEGSFPEYEQIIPTECETRAVISTSSLLKACKQAEIFAREGSHIARIKIVPGEEMQPGTVEISGQSDETGYNQNEVDATIEGPPLLIAFNVGFLREVLEVMDTPNVALETTKDTSPGVIRPIGGQEELDKFVHVIMPMHLGG